MEIPRRILVRGTNWLGDAVMTTPALLRLREKFPGAHLALLTPEKLAPLWARHPALNEIIPILPRENIFAAAKKLRAGDFDTALVFPNSPRSALEVFLARIPNRIGYARPWRNFFLTRAVAPRPDAVTMRKRSLPEIQKLISAPIQNSKLKTQNFASNQSREYLHLAAALGANPEPLPAKLFVAPEEIADARKKFRLDSVSIPIFGINPGAEYGPAKRWPADRFIAAALEIRKQMPCHWLIFGGPSDQQIADHIAQGIGSSVSNLAGQTSLRELMAALKLCRIFLANDTGPMHVAAALGVPVATIFGSTSPELTAPLPANESSLKILRSDAPCSPCFLRECPIDFRCMNGIEIDQVVKAAIGLANLSP